MNRLLGGWFIMVFSFMLQAVPAQAEKGDEVDASKVPVTRVVLFRSGVGYVERSGTVTGQASLTLSLKVEQMNDLLKSLVLQDLDGGKILPVQYAPRDPMNRTLQSFAVYLGDNPSRRELLRRLSGVPVEVASLTPANNTVQKIKGRVLGTESKPFYDETGKVRTTEDYLHLMTEEGLLTIALSQIAGFQVQDERIRNELQAALDALAGGLDNLRKPVQLQFQGSGRRRVRVGYITEMPVWKVSYRLALFEDRKPFLQGWAIVENTGDEDWRDVHVSLVSGKPVSFIQNLYEPLYATRPVYTPPIDASLMPRTYEGAIEEKAGERLSLETADKKDANAALRRAGRPAAPAEAPGGFGGGAAGLRAGAEMKMDMGIESMAEGQEMGALFEYQIDQPVSILRQQSAMLPIVNEEIEAEQVSVYNPSTHAKYPMYGAWLKNSTKLTLADGPVTVYAYNSYGGDALIETIEPGGKRLLTYALDMKMEVVPEDVATTTQVMTLKIVRGVLEEEQKLRMERVYSARNRDTRARTLFVEQLIQPGWELIEPKQPEEKTASLYRFKLSVPANDAQKLKVVEEMPQRRTIALVSADTQTIMLYLRNAAASDALKKALQEIVKRQNDIARLQADMTEANAGIQAIEQDQTRIRENMAQLDKTSELYKSYVKKLTDQENEIERLRTRVKTLQSEINTARNALANYIQNLSVS